ncbi:NlpC/P60 family protein [Actinomycetospora cinnamomea]|uniref:Cell wall-associated NlpC family hydrolase n=1 Tax=Actinomycetospora cinnamomea TaxID=663609 RepID=A0A2U1FHT0_9PSEU|nr:NlpC/P60 family protein [Actinomycetospora cinnamomea]PVZ11711.1 cell wall-associated NlpC family hydrolase [Actinomycetospora cinnamomea]
MPALRTPAVLVGLLLSLLLTAPAAPAALAGPATPVPPTPPPSPDPATDRAGEAGSLVARIASARAALDALTEDLGERQELANRALADDTAARQRADEARRAAEESRRGADAAVAAAERARADVDAWITAWFQQADVLGPLSVLSGAAGPDDVAARAHLREVVTADQREALERAELARIEAANADSRARAAREEADTAAARAAEARAAADAELARVRTDTDAQSARLRELGAERDAAEARLAELEAADPALAAQRERAEAFDEAASAREAARDERIRLAATTPDAAEDPLAAAGVDTTGMSDEVRTVLERALSQLGVVYAWGGGDAEGPTLGIRDGGVADSFGDFAKTGFDCSGLMIYAFAAAGKDLPHYSGYQAEAGPRVPLAERRPGDLLFWAEDDGAGAVHHVALYLGRVNGEDQMVEAPESGKTVRITSLRLDDEIVPTVTRLL